MKNEKGTKRGKLTISSSKKHSKTYVAMISRHKNGEENVVALDFNDVDVSSFEDGTIMLKFEVENDTALKATLNRAVILDFTPPAIEVVPIKMYRGRAKIKGRLIDVNPVLGEEASGIDEKSVEYKIGNAPFAKQHKDDGVLLSKMSSTVASWTINIPAIEKYATYNNERLHSGNVSMYGAVKVDENVWSLPLQIRVKDRAGNEKISEVYEIRFTVSK